MFYSEFNNLKYRVNLLNVSLIYNKKVVKISKLY